MSSQKVVLVYWATLYLFYNYSEVVFSVTFAVCQLD